MKKRYYIYYYNNFDNTYNLYWAWENKPVPNEYRRITRREAISHCINNPDPTFSRDKYIYPASGKYNTMFPKFNGCVIEEN